MSLYEARSEIPGAIVIGLLVAVGLAAGGWFVGKGMERFKSDSRGEHLRVRPPMTANPR